MMRIVRLRAPAKINLDLRVLYRRPDGFHELRTVFQAISIYDAIEARSRPAGEARISIAGDVEIEDNLIARAAKLALAEMRISADIEFTLEKLIPMGAGLGGGSSDAAAVLRAMPELVGSEMAADRMHALAAQLGSDVPFFLYGGTALGLGRGDEIYPLPAPAPMHGVLVAPSIHVSTAEAYRALSPLVAEGGRQAKLDDFARVLWSGLLDEPRNDFEGPVFSLYPELAEIRERLAQAGARVARMTGSGSAIFGLFEEAAAAMRAREALNRYRTFEFEFLRP